MCLFLHPSAHNQPLIRSNAGEGWDTRSVSPTCAGCTFSHPVNTLSLASLAASLSFGLLFPQNPLKSGGGKGKSIGNEHLAGHSTTLLRLFPSPSENALWDGSGVSRTGRNCGCGARTAPEVQAHSQAGVRG